jgi:hypothetical protein
MELVVRLDIERNDTVTASIRRIGDDQYSYAEVNNVLEPAIYGGLKECLRRGFIKKLRIYWDGARIDLPTKKDMNHEQTDTKEN